VLTRSRISFEDGFDTEFRIVSQHDAEVKLGERLVVFDVDDAESALAELDRLAQSLD